MATEFFQVMKMWVSQDDFFKRYDERRSLTKEAIYKRYIDKYKTVLNWLGVLYNGKDFFCKTSKEIMMRTNLTVKKQDWKKLLIHALTQRESTGESKETYQQEEIEPSCLREKKFKNRKSEYQNKLIVLGEEHILIFIF
jgi:hypothetical protein